MRDRSGWLVLTCAFAWACGAWGCGDPIRVVDEDASREALDAEALLPDADRSDASNVDALVEPADAFLGQDARSLCDGMPDGTACGEGHLCVAAVCVPSVCGDGLVDASAGEACDDGNRDASDGCEPTCAWTCVRNEDCAPLDACEGAPQCDASHRCVRGEAIVCDDGDACTIDRCDPMSGCTTERLDLDGDGYVVAPPPAGCALPSGDCDDANAQAFPGAPELCEALAPIDNDCDGDTSDSPRPRAWFVDCDGDGVAAREAGTAPTCEPPAPAAECRGRGFTDIAPGGRLDCNDNDANVFPGQTESFSTPTSTGGYDYDCDGMSTTSDRCGGDCFVNYGSGPCGMRPSPICTGACGSMAQRVSYCSDAVRCRNVYWTFAITCR